MLHDLIPAAAMTAVPILLLAPVVWALRPQGGRRWLGIDPIPAALVLADLAAERKALKKAGVTVPGQFGDTTRPPAWTVPPAYATDRRDMTGAFPVVRAA